jgi:DNA (cytosine-5)-methyltransferase 1
LAAVDVSIRVFDFFSGCGGTSAGLQHAGMEIVFALDSDHDSANSFRTNFPGAIFQQGDIAAFEPVALSPLVRTDIDRPILFAGCAPCQPFSKRNRARNVREDGRANLLKHFGEFVEFHLPDYVLVENVPGLQDLDIASPGPLPEFLVQLKRLAYSWDVRVVRSQDYGVPQRRARLILLASRHGAISLPQPTHGPSEGPKLLDPLIPYRTAWDAIRHLPPLEAGQAHPAIPNHACAGLNPLNLERMRHTPAGGDRRDWPEHLLLDCHRKLSDEVRLDAEGNKKRDTSLDHLDVYGRVRKDQPASGLTTRCISLSNGRFGHPDPAQHRALSVREAACLQTFPEDFVFHGALNSTARQVGNAVPVLLAQRLGEQIGRHWVGVVEGRVTETWGEVSIGAEFHSVGA